MKNKQNKIILSVIIVVALLFGGIMSWYFLFPTSSESEDVVDDNSSDVAVEDTSIILGSGSSGDGYEEKDGNFYITKAGTYRLTGTLSGSVIVEALNSDVTLELNGVTITSNDGGAIIGKEIHTLTVVLVEDTTNQISDGGDSDYDAALYANGNLILDGTGTLIVNGNVEEGIATESADITIQSGNYQITSKDDGINAGGDGGVITINDGTFYIYSEGDGIDSNQDLIINGGNIFVEASGANDNAALDCDGAYKINGGTVVGLGMGMMQNPDSDSVAYTILWNLSSKLLGNTSYSIYKNGVELISFESIAEYQTLTVSSPDITADTYTFYQGGSHSGILSYGIYKNGSYTPGESISISGTTSYQVNNIITRFGNAR